VFGEHEGSYELLHVLVQFGVLILSLCLSLLDAHRLVLLPLHLEVVLD
jgi:hypothetical protein